MSRYFRYFIVGFVALYAIFFFTTLIPQDECQMLYNLLAFTCGTLQSPPVLLAYIMFSIVHRFWRLKNSLSRVLNICQAPSVVCGVNGNQIPRVRWVPVSTYIHCLHSVRSCSDGLPSRICQLRFIHAVKNYCIELLFYSRVHV